MNALHFIIEEEIKKFLFESIAINENDVEQDSEEKVPEEIEKATQNLETTANGTQIDQGDGESVPLSPQNDRIVNFKIDVPVYMEHLLDKAVLSMAKLARKAGIDPPQVLKGTPKRTKLYRGTDAYMEPIYISVDVIPVEVVVEGIFKLPGNYKLEAIIDTQTGGSVAIGTDKIPSEYLSPSHECDYCHTNRLRIKNYIVKGEQGNYMKLGSNCVKKFLGINIGKYLSVLNVYNVFKETLTAFGDDEDRGGGGGRTPFSPKLRVYDLDKAITIIHNIWAAEGGLIKREWGETESRWGSQRYQKNTGSATADKAEKIMFDADQKKRTVDQTYVNKFKQFLIDLKIPVDAKEGFANFLEKIISISEQDFRIKDTAILAVAINFYEEDAKRQLANAQNKGSQFIGNVGEKVKIKNAKLTGFNSGEGAFGTWYLWSFVDENGNIMKKFGELGDKFKVADAPEGSPDLQYFSKGDLFSFTAEIKKMEEYRGVKTTVLGRLSKY